MITWLEVNEGDEDGEVAKGVNVTVFNQCRLQCFHLTNDPVKTVLLQQRICFQSKLPPLQFKSDLYIIDPNC